jgi:hypothetical protein
MKNLIWVRQVSSNFANVTRMSGPFSSYKKAEKFVLRTGDGTIVTESLEDAKVRITKQVADEYDRSNTSKLLLNTLEPMAIEPKQKKTEKVETIQSVEGPKRQVAKRTPTPAKKKVEATPPVE